jgi:hypothetical protein
LQTQRTGMIVTAHRVWLADTGSIGTSPSSPGVGWVDAFYRCPAQIR